MTSEELAKLQGLLVKTYMSNLMFFSKREITLVHSAEVKCKRISVGINEL